MKSCNLLFAFALTVVSCGSSSSSPTDAIVTKQIGPDGGVIEVEGAVVTFPEGAVASPTTVTISAREKSAVPVGYVALSRVFECEPSGTSFARPVEMRMPFTDDGGPASLFWSTGADRAFRDVGGRVEGKTMVATVQHFSSGFVGRKL
ncbi:MAG TPA: hypothetical protein VM580_28605 [Labilithrix sp.]|jgi:hypothetical protein|nr:hypothetical protein [Labilithrix sp.]